MLRADASKLLVHTVAVEVARDVALLVRGLNGCLSRPHRDQLLRTSLSIPSNIAEACGQATMPQFRRFLIFSRGSTQELLSQLRLVQPRTSRQGSELQTIRNRTALVLKLLNRLHAHPPPEV